MLTVLLQGCSADNRAIACDMFTCVVDSLLNCEYLIYTRKNLTACQQDAFALLVPCC